jgi:membrane fusion protein, multidrug efflux system
MAQKPVLTEVESEASVGVRTTAAGADIRLHGVPATVADSIASRLYEDHLLLRREVSRLHDEIDKLRQEREESEEEDAIESDRPAEAIPLRLARWARRRPFVALILLIAIAAAIPASGRLWSFINSYEDTDDAQVDAHIDPVSTRINGTIERVYVDDNVQVKAGQLLAEIDPRDYQVELEQARANYLQAQAQVKSAISDYDTAQARAQAAIAANSMAQHEADRYGVLSKHGVASAEQAEQASSTANVDSATVAAARAASDAASMTRAAREASVAAAKALLDQAELNLTYTKIVAPVAGIVGKRSVEVGQRVEPGQELLALVRNDDLWVTANFKETQLIRMHLGQPATVRVDTYGTDFQGHVESMAGASGEKYSLLPPENATGNYVKIVQRIPVRIRLDGQQGAAEKLRPGMSVEATIWLK